MSYANLEFKTKTASVQSVIALLNECSNVFDPPLRTYDEIEAHGNRIADKAITFEAWESNLLIGLIAAYLNDFESKTCFITNVSIHPLYRRKGIANKLFFCLLEYCKLLTFNRIQLEVNRDNASALNLYYQNGFFLIEKNGNKLLMEMVLKL